MKKKKRGRARNKDISRQRLRIVSSQENPSIKAEQDLKLKHKSNH